jgi:ATP-dependent RNA circularization protein (DNA/RNA ligase family)
MKQYSKIQTIFKRDMTNKGRIIIGDYSLPEFEYLRDNEWVFTEKVDGTNIRIMWDGESLSVGGKTDNAQIPVPLFDRLHDVFNPSKFKEADLGPMTLYGEGYGKKIQKGGGNYKADGVDFVMFDVKIEEWWLQRKDIEDIGGKLNIDCVPIIGRGTLQDAGIMAMDGFDSVWGNFKAEGIVLKPAIEMKTRRGDRIIAKIKHRDYI